jgi:hypothetical protein
MGSVATEHIEFHPAPDDGQKGCPKHVIVIPIKMEFRASVGFIHKEFFTMHGHTILKCCHHVLIMCGKGCTS